MLDSAKGVLGLARRLKTLADVRRHLAAIVNRVESGELDPSTAGRLGYLLNILRAVIERGDLERRVQELEAKLQLGIGGE